MPIYQLEYFKIYVVLEQLYKHWINILKIAIKMNDQVLKGKLGTINTFLFL